MNDVKIVITESPLFHGLAMQLFMTKGDKYCRMQLDNEYFRKNLQKHICEGFKMLSEGE